VIVVDASLAVKWFLPERDSAEAALVLERNLGDIVGPDLLGIEVCATLVRGANMVRTNRADALKSIGKFRNMIDDGVVGLQRTTLDQQDRAARHAIEIGHPLKDCLYLALAMDLDCPLVTCDERFAAKAKGVWTGVRVLGAG
jgi:predicted nucleic acid-binding protein